MTDLEQLRARLRVAENCGHPATHVMLSPQLWARIKTQYVAETGYTPANALAVLGVPIRLSDRFNEPALVYG